jgi:hypothetical protein
MLAIKFADMNNINDWYSVGTDEYFSKFYRYIIKERPDLKSHFRSDNLLKGYVCNQYDGMPF